MWLVGRFWLSEAIEIGKYRALSSGGVGQVLPPDTSRFITPNLSR
jgi:hypothetical protein